MTIEGAEWVRNLEGKLSLPISGYHEDKEKYLHLRVSNAICKFGRI